MYAEGGRYIHTYSFRCISTPNPNHNPGRNPNRNPNLIRTLTNPKEITDFLGLLKNYLKYFRTSTGDCVITCVKILVGSY